ncbi:hypothetical protein OTU49_012316 [Cherax quadricarinatus]|uniref:Uncharacterized protein n=1 Tax=Cherax quadricarinatus TaxID=27406 RepID=A0AAW0W031_CHEQU
MSTQHFFITCRGGGRRRRYEGEDYGPRVKRLRGPPNFRGRTEKPGNTYNRERMRERSPVYRSVPRREGSSYNGTSSHKLCLESSLQTYQDFMREMRDFHSRAPSNLPPMAFPPPYVVCCYRRNVSLSPRPPPHGLLPKLSHSFLPPLPLDLLPPAPHGLHSPPASSHHHHTFLKSDILITANS